jgi:Fe2+ or Zn2+ uptake regulation protein
VQHKSYEQHSKKREQDFTQKRNMLLSLLKESTRNALERVFAQLKKENAHKPAGIQ